MELTELEAQQLVHIKELEARLAAAEAELADYAKTVERLREDRNAAHERIDALLDELGRAKTRIKELMEIYQ